MAKYSGIFIVNVGHKVEGEYDTLEEFKSAILENFKNGYSWENHPDASGNPQLTWYNGHNFVEYVGIKEGSIKEVTSIDVE